MKKYDIKTTDTETLKKWYHLMVLGRALDEKAPSYLLQSLGWSYHAPYAGHDGIQLAVGQVFTKGEDFLFPYYRDMLTVLSAGMSVEELILNGISKATDPGSGGRHMSNHFAKPEWHIENVSSATGTHDLHAAGVARAMVYYGHKGVAITSHGESASSEGYVYEAINGASREGLPVIFVWQDNGYGISVPKKDQTVARKYADNFSGFKNLKIIHCNGKDVFDSMNAMSEAREFAIAHRTPVIVHANCVRIGSHSNSDKQTLYRDENELAYVKEADPLMKFCRMLLRYKRLTEEELQQIEAAAKKELSVANRKALAAPDPDPKSIFDYVLPDPYIPEKYKEGLHQEVANVAGVVSFRHPVTDGMSVSKGAPILNISAENMPDGDPVKRTRIAYETAKKEYERAAKLVKSQIISQKDFNAIKESYENALLAYEAISKNQTKTGVSVTAPLGGYIKNCLVKEGDYVSVGQPLVSITQNRRLFLRVDVSEKYYGYLHSIQSANFKTPYDNKVYELGELKGHLLSYGKASGGTSFYVPVTFEFDNRGDVIPGSYVEVYLLSSEMPDVLALPVTALTEEQGLYFIYLQLDEEGYKKQEVTLGASDGKEVQILTGLKAGDRVVTKGAYQVKLASASNAIPAHSHEH